MCLLTYDQSLQIDYILAYKEFRSASLVEISGGQLYERLMVVLMIQVVDEPRIALLKFT